MKELILACVGILLELLVFTCTGALMLRILKLKQELSFALVLGYITYFAVFELLAVPMTLMWAPLKLLCIVWAIVFAAASVAGGVCLWRERPDWRRAGAKMMKEHSFLLLVLVLVILAQCAIVVLYQDTTVDAAYYVGTVNTSVYTGTLGRYNPYTGAIYRKFQARYVFSAYPMHNAVWCQLLRLPALIQCKVVMSVINVMVANLILYHIGKVLFDGKKKQADLMVCFACLLQLFTGTIYTSGTFFFTRSYEGKSLLANVSVPMVLLLSLWLYKVWAGEGKRHQERAVWILLFLTALSALDFSGSAIIFPVVISGGFLPLILVHKKFSRILQYGICMLPTVLYAGAYFAVKAGLLTLAAS